MKQKVTTREAILEHALAIAKREGLDQVSIRKLAKECGIAVGSMYNYYPDKQTLINAVSQDFWSTLIKDQDRLYREGMGFTFFLDQYYMFLYAKLSDYDRSWLKEMDQGTKNQTVLLFKSVLDNDDRVNQSIWNMELNQDIFCNYVLTNIIALLRAGGNDCRFFVFLLEHLLYDV